MIDVVSEAVQAGNFTIGVDADPGSGSSSRVVDRRENAVRSHHEAAMWIRRVRREFANAD